MFTSSIIFTSCDGERRIGSLTITSVSCGDTHAQSAALQCASVPPERRAKIAAERELLCDDLANQARLLGLTTQVHSEPIVVVADAWKGAENSRKRVIANALDGGFYTDDPLVLFVRYLQRRNSELLSAMGGSTVLPSRSTALELPQSNAE